MIFDPTSSILYVFENSGACIHTNVETMKPIQIALSAEGGTVALITYYLESLKSDFYQIQYSTPCGKIQIAKYITKEEYLYNIDFFGERIVFFDQKVNFDLDGNKFKMP